MMARALFLVLALTLAAGPVLAVQPQEMLADPQLEHRAREISKNLRCLVCQNQSIDDSDADLARDLRVLVRERLKAGDSDTQVVDFVVKRYGDFVLLRPPVKENTLVLWAGPAVIALLGVLAVFAFYRRRRGQAAPAAKPLSPEEKARLEKLMQGDRT